MRKRIKKAFIFSIYEPQEHRDHDLKITFKACNHQNKYSFRHKSPLKEYLERFCEGFVKSEDDTYTINYILVVLLANCAARELIFCETFNTKIKTTSHLKKAFKTTAKILNIRGLRQRVIHQLDASEEERLMHYNPSVYLYPLWCIDESVKNLLKSLFKIHYRLEAFGFVTSLCQK